MGLSMKSFPGLQLQGWPFTFPCSSLDAPIYVSDGKQNIYVYEAKVKMWKTKRNAENVSVYRKGQLGTGKK